MLGDISPQTVRITQQAVVYPSRDHVTSLRVERFDGRTYKPVDMTAVTRVILSFPEADPVIVYDSAVQAVFTHVGTTLTVDLSDYAMPVSVLGCQIILYDAEHPAGQVLVDDIDAVVQFDFRNVSPVGGIPAPAVDYLTDAPIDGVTYARKDGLWVPVDALVSGVSSVNGQSGVVVLDAADVGADPAGTATTASAAAVAAHTALADPHPQYLTPAEGNAAYDASGAATSAVSAHVADSDPHPQYTTQSEGDARYERGLTAGANITIDRTNPVAPVISASGGGGGGAVDSVNGQTGVVVLDAADVGADAAGTAAAAVAAHVAATNPHPEYLTQVEGDTAYAPIAHVGAGGAAHANAVAAGAAGFMTGADKTKLDGVAAGATANADTDSLSEGTTNKYFTELRVLATVMAGLTLIAGGAVSAADSLLVAIGKIQKQINDLFSDKQDALVSGTTIKTVNGSGLLGSGNLYTDPVVQTFTGNKTLALTDINAYNVSQDATAQVVTLPAQVTVAWTADAEITIEQGAAGAVTITGAAGVTINGVVAPSIVLFAKGAVATLKRKGLNNWALVGAIGTAADQRAALELIKQTSTTDTTVGSLMINGAHGLGMLTAPPTPADVNSTSLPTGLYRISTTDAAQRPPGSVNAGVMLVERFSAVVIRQTWGEAVTSAGVRRMWYRTSYATDTWDDWQELWTSYGTNVITVDTGAFGHATGSGGTATQATSKSTGVTLNKPSGQVTMNAAALAANTAVSFTLTNSKIAANDLPRVVIKSGATAGAYVVQVDAVAAGSCRISVRNMTGGSLSEALVLQFNNEKGATA